MNKESHDYAEVRPQFVHPLARNDRYLIQEFMLTKIILLVARDADESEWAFELELMDTNLGDARGREHIFLFAYTVARYCLAVAHAQPIEVDHNSTTTGAGSPFVNEFLVAVDAGAFIRALSLWETSGFSSETDVSAPVIRRLTFELLRVPAAISSQGFATSFADFLPAPYSGQGSETASTAGS